METTRTRLLSRRLFTTGLGAVGAAALLPWGGPRAVAAPSGPWADRAENSYRALREHLFRRDAGLYREGLGGGAEDNPYSFVWPLREATAAAQDLGRLRGAEGLDTEVAAHFEALERYFDEPSQSYASYPVPPLGAGGDSFYDDNAIIGLEQVRRFRLGGGGTEMVTRAARALDFVVQAWDTGSTGPRAGGMHWVDAPWNPYQGGTNVTALAAELAAHLYEQSGERRHLEWAERSYDWVRRSMRRDPGLYANGLLLDGTTEETLWSYNSGAMIGAATLLHRATGERRWLRRAQLDAEAALAHWTGQDRLYEQPAAFNAIFLANLLLFCSVRPSWAAEVLDPFAAYADRLWEENRDPANGLFTFGASGGGAPDPDQLPQTLHQAATVQIFSLLAWDPTDYPDAA